jgi:hypothetical protein
MAGVRFAAKSRAFFAFRLGAGVCRLVSAIPVLVASTGIISPDHAGLAGLGTGSGLVGWPVSLSPV